jgi:hypothetical protein
MLVCVCALCAVSAVHAASFVPFCHPFLGFRGNAALVLCAVRLSFSCISISLLEKGSKKEARLV